MMLEIKFLVFSHNHPLLKTILMTERELQKNIVDYLKKLGVFYFAIIPPTRKTMISGARYYLPDLFILNKGKPIFIELKLPEYKEAHKDHQVKQELVRQDIIAHGGSAYKITSLNELKEIL